MCEADEDEKRSEGKETGRVILNWGGGYFMCLGTMSKSLML